MPTIELKKKRWVSWLIQKRVISKLGLLVSHFTIGPLAKEDFSSLRLPEMVEKVG
jgi:hypothetical protein